MFKSVAQSLESSSRKKLLAKISDGDVPNPKRLLEIIRNAESDYILELVDSYKKGSSRAYMNMAEFHKSGIFLLEELATNPELSVYQNKSLINRILDVIGDHQAHPFHGKGIDPIGNVVKIAKNSPESRALLFAEASKLWGKDHKVLDKLLPILDGADKQVVIEAIHNLEITDSLSEKEAENSDTALCKMLAKYVDELTDMMESDEPASDHTFDNLVEITAECMEGLKHRSSLRPLQTLTDLSKDRFSHKSSLRKLGNLAIDELNTMTLKANFDELVGLANKNPGTEVSVSIYEKIINLYDTGLDELEISNDTDQASLLKAIQDLTHSMLSDKGFEQILKTTKAQIHDFGQSVDEKPLAVAPRLVPLFQRADQLNIENTGYSLNAEASFRGRYTARDKGRFFSLPQLDQYRA